MNLKALVDMQTRQENIVFGKEEDGVQENTDSVSVGFFQCRSLAVPRSLRFTS